MIVRDGDAYRRDYDRPQSIGRIAGSVGNVPALVKAYAWIRSIGPERMADVARYAVLNNNYMHRRLSEVPGITTSIPGNPERRLDVVRYSLEELSEETGVGTEAVRDRITDYGLPGHWMSHHPVTSPEPFTLEPTESFSRRDLDEVAAIYEQVVGEARTDPDLVRSAPHRGPVARMRAGALQADRPLATWRLLKEAALCSNAGRGRPGLDLDAIVSGVATSTTLTLDDVDLLDHDLFADHEPWEVFELLQREAPVF